MEEEDQKTKHVCKLCNKRYPSGKSLGGHMRSHMIGNSAEAAERKKISSLNGGRSSKKDSGFEGGGHSAYGLRENPKKTWRLANSRSGSQQENVCKECGKVFQSLKALCGHMACHSEKERLSSNLEDHSWTNASQKPVMDRRKRSKRTNFNRTLAVYPSPSVSDTEQEQQELAICLMMLSRDSGHWGGLNSLVYSSDNNSVVLEAKSSSIDMRISRGEDMNCVSDGDEIVETKKLGDGKSKSAVLDSEAGPFENSDSGYFMNGAQRVESDVSVDGVFRNVESLELKLEDGSGFDVFGAESGKVLKRLKCMKAGLGKDLKRPKCVKTELGKGLLKQEGYDRVNRASVEYDLSKRAKNDSYSEENFRKRSKYQCLTCNKTFHSHQALGGHRANHKRVEGCNSSNYESIENSIETDTCPGPTPHKKLARFGSGKTPIAQDLSGKAEKKIGSRKSNGHMCPICFKVFRSGQALGGHKKSHFVGVCEDENSRTLVIKQEPLEIPGLIDLNLPAPIEEEANEHVGFMIS